MSSPDVAPGDPRETLVNSWLARAGVVAEPGRLPSPEPVSAREATLIRVWEEVLGREGVRPDDDYFVLGGDSISAVAVVSRAVAAGVPITTHDLFQLRTVRAILTASPAEPITRAVVGRTTSSRRRPLTPLQQGMLFQTLADSTGRTQIVQVSALVEGDIAPAELARACRAVVQRHPALRASVHWDAAGSWMQVHEQAEVRVHELDLRSLPEPDATLAVADVLERDIATGFDLGAAPLLRFSLVREADRTLRFVLTHHHLVLDGWSQQIVLRDLLQLYDGIELPPPHGEEHLAGQDTLELRSALARWRELMTGYVPALVRRNPVTDFDHRAAITRSSAVGHVGTAAARHGVTPATVVYAAWSVITGALTGADDVATGVVLAGRPATPDAPDLVGMYIATLPLRVRLAGRDPLGSWIGDVQVARAELDSLRSSSLTEIARMLPGAVVPSGSAALFDTLVVVENFPEHVVDGTRSERLTVTDVRGSVWEGYPLVVEVRLGSSPSARLRADAALFTAERIDQILGAFSAVVARAGDHAAATVHDLRVVAARHLDSPQDQPSARLRSVRRQIAPAPSRTEGSS